MIPPRIRAVYFKELHDAIRDRRTLFATVIVPILLYPIMVLGLAEVAQQAKARMDREIYAVAIPTGTRATFLKMTQLPDPGPDPDKKPAPAEAGEISPAAPKTGAGTRNEARAEAPKEPALVFEELSPEEAAKRLKAGSIRAVVSIDPDIEARLRAGGNATIKISYDRAERRSQETLARLDELIKRYEAHALHERLQAARLNEAYIKPISLVTENVAAAVKVSGSIIGSFLPLIFIMMIIAGAMNPATDMTAGEKERFTLEALISMPARPLEIISGKFLAVATLALGNAALNVASFGLTISVMPLPQGGSFQFPWQALPATLLLLAPLTLLFSGLLLAVSSLAANVKEAQVYCLPVYLIPVLGLMVVMMPGIELEGPLLLAPVLNTALLIKELFLGRGTAMQMMYVFCSTSMYAAGTVALAARLFAREDVLFSSQGSFRVFLKRKFFKPSLLPRAGDSLLLLALLFPVFFYVQSGIVKALVDLKVGIQPLQFVVMMLVPQFTLFLGLPLLLAWYLKIKPSTTFQWRKPPLRALAGAACLALGAWPVVLQLLSWQTAFWPIAGDDSLEKALYGLTSSAGGIALLIFVMAVTPALCEEHLFRGFLQQGLVGSGKWTALLLVGVIFGAYHLPLYRQPITMTMGVVLAYVAFESRSIWPGVLLHFLYNSLQVVGPNITGLDDATLKAFKGVPGVALQYLLPGIALFAAGLLLVRRSAPAPVPMVSLLDAAVADKI